MNKHLLTLVLGLFAASTAIADQAHSPLNVGSGNAAAAKVVFNTGNGSTNAYVGASSGGALQLSNNGGSNILTIPTITDTIATLTASQTLTNKTLTSPTINGGTYTGTLSGGTVSGGTLSGTIGGSPTLSGAPTFSGSVTMSATGGNVPHGCTVRNSGSAGSTCYAGCNAGEIAVGGGVTCSGNMTQSAPGSGGGPITSGTPVGWYGACTVGATPCYAVCCSY